jgi:hypothetical protein
MITGLFSLTNVCLKFLTKLVANRLQRRVLECVTSQHVGQLRGRIKGFCAYHLKLRDFFMLLSLKPKRDRVSLRGGMVYSQSVKEFNMTSFYHLFVGKR